MKNVRVFLSYDPAPNGRGYFVDLPTYVMLPGTHQPIGALIHADGVFPTANPAAVMALQPSVMVAVPDADTHPLTGKPSMALIRSRYSNHTRFGQDTAYALPLALTIAERDADLKLGADMKALGKIATEIVL